MYSGQATSLDSWSIIVAGAFIFSVISGCVYIINDIFDREEDRNHPVKQHRPIASGQMPVGIAALVAIGGIFLAGAAAFWLDQIFVLVIIAYILQNIAYSAVLKHLFLIDIFIVGTGFVLRALAGVLLIDATLSPWLFLSVFLAAFLLASGKRRAEVTSSNESNTRTSVENYTSDFSLFVLFISAATLLMVYSLYTFFARQTAMMVTIPLAYYSVLRICHLIVVQPTEQMYKLLFRRDMLTTFVLWGITTVTILYIPYPP